MPDNAPRDGRSLIEDSRIILRGVRAADGSGDLMVDHPEQPADYRHMDGTLWTWNGRWRLIGGTRVKGGFVGATHVRAYDPATSTMRRE